MGKGGGVWQCRIEGVKSVLGRYAATMGIGSECCRVGVWGVAAMRGVVIGCCVGYVLQWLRYQRREWVRAQGIYEDQPWMVAAFPRYVWYSLSNPWRPRLAWLWSAAINRRCPGCGKLWKETSLWFFST